MMRILRVIAMFTAAIIAISCSSSDDEGIYTGDPGEVIDLTAPEFSVKVADPSKGLAEWEYLGDKPAIVAFHATWCPYCNRIAPILAQLSVEYKEEIYVYKVDVDIMPSIANAYGVKMVPTIFFIPMVGEPKIVDGAISKKEFETHINSVMLNK